MGKEYGFYNFILGDYFVVDSSPCRFDTTMTLKEDYDFTCSHIKTHGSALRCNRMFVHAKHAKNAGGAVAVRDAAGTKEQYNINILQTKWPGVFKTNVKRKNEVLMRWKHAGEEGLDAPQAAKKKAGSKGLVKNKIVKKAKATITKKTAGLQAKLHKMSKFPSEFAATSIVRFTSKADGQQSKYMVDRCKKLHNKTVEQCMGVTYTDAAGGAKKYGMSDLRYDVKAGRLQVQKA